MQKLGKRTNAHAMIASAIGATVNMRANSIKRLYPGFKFYALYIFQVILNVFRSILNIYFIKYIIESIEFDINNHEVSTKTIIIISSFFVINMLIKLLLTIFNNCLENYRFHTRHQNINYLESLLLNVNYQTKDSNEFMYSQKILMNFVYKDRIFNIINSMFNVLTNLAILIYALFIVKTYIVMLIIILILLGIMLVVSSNFKHKADYELEIFEDEISIKTEYLRGTLIDFDYGADIRMFKMQKKLKNRLKEGSSTEAKAFSKYYYKYFLAELIIIVTYLFFTCFFNCYLGYQLVIEKSITISFFSQMVAALTTSYATFKAISYGILEIKYYKKYKNDFLEVYSLVNKMENNENLDQLISSIEFKSVSFKYPNTEFNVLDKINLKFEKGKKYFIVGQNGVGKTTIYNLLLKFYDNYDGIIEVNGKDIKKLNMSNYYNHFSVLFQNYNLLPFKFKDNLEPNIEEKKILDLINEFDLQCIDINKNYSKQFDKDGIELSGGQLQKFAFIRAVSKNGDVIILDEPFSALDIFSELKIYDFINKNFNDKIVLITSHRLNVWKVCDEILVIDGGKVIEHGNHQSLMNLEGKYFDLYQKQEGAENEK